MSALAGHLGVPLSTATSLVKRLVQKELVDRTPSAEDQRIMHVDLTAEGEKLALQAKAVMESMFARVRAELTPEEPQQFLSLAVKVGKALQGKESGKAAPDPKFRKIAIDD
ncbi:MarR family transcriptional regulator [Paenibacillus sp. P25]|nr:MarR family transcriptional regulator [Paenibacillus sp. P25]